MAKVNAGSKQEPPSVTVAVLRPVLGDFFAFEILWSSEAEAPIFNSEGAARWFFRNNRLRLVKANATIIHTGRVLVHPARFALVAQEVALENAQRRVGEVTQ